MHTIWLLLSSIHLNNNYLFNQWATGLFFCSIGISYFVSKKTIPLLGISTFYFIAHMIWISILPNNMYNHIGDGRFGLSLQALWEFVSGFILVLSFILIPKEWLKNILKSIPLYGFINSLYVIYNFVTSTHLPQNNGFHGFLDYSGMNGCLIAMCLSATKIEFRWRPIVAWCVGLFAVYLSKSSIAYGLVILSIMCQFLHSPRVWLSVPVLSLLIAYFSEGENLFNSGLRFQAYRVFMTEWLNDGAILFGKGMGAYQYFFSDIQLKAGFQVGGGGIWQWRWLHSDWLQVLWQYGACGFVLALLLFLNAFYRALFISNTLTALLITSAGCAVFNYPLRYFPTAVLLSLALVLPFRKE